MKAYFKVEPVKLLESIKVEDLFDDTYSLWDGIISHCAERLTNRQMIDVYKSLCIWLSKIDKDDIPYIFYKMFDEFKEAMEKRNITI